MNSSIVLILFVLSMMNACSGFNKKEKQVERIKGLEWVLMDENDTNRSASEKMADAKKLKDEYHQFVSAFPQDTLAPLFLYNIAMLEADQFKNYVESAKLLEQFQREYPEHTLASKALFLQGFTYAEYVKDYKRAELVYRLFIQKYPDSEMVPSIEFELKNLGKSPEELLNLNVSNE
ncbi:tetratricopeptide repeat protein [bacterium]|nr:MAG: tetratricopeptide repeat protein [bacterium]